MMEFLLLSIFCSASLSLLSYVYCWHDIRGGRPHILSLRQITTIMDRNRLNHMFGKPETGYYYVLKQAQREAVIRKWRWFYIRECTADITCIVGVWLYMTGTLQDENIVLFSVLASVCQMINLVYSFCLINKWQFQLREEIDSSDD